MIQKVVLSIASLVLALAANGFQKKDNHLRCEAVRLPQADKEILRSILDGQHAKYDPRERMITKVLTGWNYHTDAETGMFHEVRGSLYYASGLLDLGEPAYRRRAFDIVERTLRLQDTVKESNTFGIWPYYLEEPLATKQSPPDKNWADFNGVTLLDIYMGHEAQLPAGLKAGIRRALINAALSIQKRNVHPGYTNIAIMGTYVTYAVAHLFDLPDMQRYAADRLNGFYDYTLKNGFTEYNSPTYTVVALDELSRMKKHFTDKAVQLKVAKLYYMGWEMIARHYHRPSGQWAGPHSRSYSTLLQPAVKGFLAQASTGKINLPVAAPRPDVKIRHEIPAGLLHYFLSPQYPRTQTDSFVVNEPLNTGTTYLAGRYALSTASRSTMWNQRRPFLLYWGVPEQPRYLQLRFLHDFYDFAAAAFYSRQHTGSVLAGINFLTNGGDRHISASFRLKDGKFAANDLRLRFEFGGIAPSWLKAAAGPDSLITLDVDGLTLQFRLLRAVFGRFNGRWEVGGDDKAAWIDVVLYAGEKKDFDLARMEDAALLFTFCVADPAQETGQPQVLQNGNVLTARWRNMQLDIPVKPAEEPRHL